MKILKMLKDFIKNIKKFCTYIVKVDFKELFINTGTLVCYAIMAAFVYLPIGIIRDMLNDFIQFFTPISGLGGEIYIFIFKLISAVLAILVFIYFFNKRYANIDKESSKDNKEKKKDKESKEDKDKNNDDLDLPKEKDE